MKKLAVFILAFCLLSGTVLYAERAVTVSSECSVEDINEPLEASAPSATIGQKLDIKAKSVILMEPVTGKVLYEDNQDEKTPPASITKIMSLLLVMEAIDRKDISLETVVTASEHASSMGGSQIWLKPGETMTVNDLLKATVIASANDACVALGELIAGSEEGFVAMMNRRAKELGMTSTNFVNCTGLDADGHLTTAYDVALMSSELIKHPLIKDYSTVWMDSLRDGKSELVNTNKLVRFYEGTTGLKTGTTATAKYCLSATAQRNGLELVAVVMSADSTADRFNGAKKLLDYGFANYNFSSIDAGIDENTTVKVSKGTKSEVRVKPTNDLSVLMPKSASGNIERKVSMNENVTAPVKEGDLLGTVTVSMGDESLGEIPIVADESVGRLTFGVTFGWILKGLFRL